MSLELVKLTQLRIVSGEDEDFIASKSPDKPGQSSSKYKQQIYQRVFDLRDVMSAK